MEAIGVNILLKDETQEMGLTRARTYDLQAMRPTFYHWAMRVLFYHLDNVLMMCTLYTVISIIYSTYILKVLYWCFLTNKSNLWLWCIYLLHYFLLFTFVLQDSLLSTKTHYLKQTFRPLAVVKTIFSCCCFVLFCTWIMLCAYVVMNLKCYLFIFCHYYYLFLNRVKLNIHRIKKTVMLVIL